MSGIECKRLAASASAAAANNYLVSDGAAAAAQLEAAYRAEDDWKASLKRLAYAPP